MTKTCRFSKVVDVDFSVGCGGQNGKEVGDDMLMSGNDAPAVCQKREPYGFGLRQHFGRRKSVSQLRSASIGSRLARLRLALALQLHVVIFWFGLNCLGLEASSVGSFKINCDASFQLRSGKAGVGVIIRNHKGFVVAAKASPVMGCSSVVLWRLKLLWKAFN
ncbi:hypothetical protein LWI28_014031 [Acer negundo]|uniref:RNase H type-1 domain-containing protein n=1 Tax=Acer negundo TaxID=4023 RepID=A0AAD5JFD4_ACENE|nr:hypothetical protein LWI28_014031 [Acer negundo]